MERDRDMHTKKWKQSNWFIEQQQNKSHKQNLYLSRENVVVRIKRRNAPWATDIVFPIKTFCPQWVTVIAEMSTIIVELLDQVHGIRTQVKPLEGDRREGKGMKERERERETDRQTDRELKRIYPCSNKYQEPTFPISCLSFITVHPCSARMETGGLTFSVVTSTTNILKFIPGEGRREQYLKTIYVLIHIYTHCVYSLSSYLANRNKMANHNVLYSMASHAHDHQL